MCWRSISTQFCCARVCDVQAGFLSVRSCVSQAPQTLARRILLRSPAGKSNVQIHFRPWDQERAFLSQYHWADSTPLLNSSTTQLRALQVRHRRGNHAAHHKWELTFSFPVPETIWSNIWLTYRGAAENTFLWQLFYRVIATQKWQFPQKPATHPCTWCTRCTTGIREDLTHCIWACEISAQSWLWGASILQMATSNQGARILLSPEQVFIAVPLPNAWLVPDRLWQILKAILCWQIWKNRNAHYMAGKQASTQKIIRKSWHRLGIYLRKEWRFLARKVELGKLSMEEATSTMKSQFSSCPSIWNLHGVTLQVPPVPPRPP